MAEITPQLLDGIFLGFHRSEGWSADNPPPSRSTRRSVPNLFDHPKSHRLHLTCDLCGNPAPPMDFSSDPIAMEPIQAYSESIHRFFTGCAGRLVARVEKLEH